MLNLSAQACDGNLGVNIFTDGDFGSGTANIPSTNPQIAPGYTYTTGAPDDGFYTITNDIAEWSFLFAGWMPISDNSDDPDGYMMVVNATFAPGLFYEQEVNGLCENTLYEFSADVYNLIEQGSNFILPNVSFLLDGAVLFDTGDIPENETWNNYGFTFSTAPGQTSITLSLQNNAPGGNGNDLAIDNINFRVCGPQALIAPENVSLCEDAPPVELEATIDGTQFDNPVLQWQQSTDGINWVDIPGETGSTFTHNPLTTGPGVFYYRYLLANGLNNLLNSNCYIASDVTIINVIPKFYSIVDTLCEGASFSFGEIDLFNTGIYIDTFSTDTGCDSILTLDLTISGNTQIEFLINSNPPSCSYLIDGQIALESIVNGSPPFSVFFNGEPSTLPFEMLGLGEGSYSIEVVDKFDCSFDTTLVLETPSPFEVELGPDLELELGASVEIMAILNDASQPVSNYNWNYLPETGLAIDCPIDCSTIELSPTNSTFLTVEATSENSCKAYDTLYIEVNKALEIAIPTAFTPNGDGLNDFFSILGNTTTVEQIEELLIFNRWGELLFEGKQLTPNNLQQGWDGTHKGEQVEIGAYLYLAQIRFLDGETILYSGDVTLIR